MAAAVGEEDDLAFSAGKPRPRLHDKRIIDGENSNRVDASADNGVVVFEIAGEMAIAAGRGECAGNSKQNDLLACEQFGRGDCLHTVGSRNLESGIRQLPAFFDRHMVLLGEVVKNSGCSSSASFRSADGRIVLAMATAGSVRTQGICSWPRTAPSVVTRM